MLTNHKLLPVKETDEKALLLQIASGDQVAFAQIVGRYTNIVYPHLLSYIKDAQRAEEITQDIFMSLWSNRIKLTAIENFAGYVYTMTINRAKTGLKERLARIRDTTEDQLQRLFTAPDSSVELKELTAILNKGIDSLPARRKEVFLLSRQENKTYEEIGAQLNISRSAVRQHIVEALVFLRTYLKEETGIIVSGVLWMMIPN